MLIRKTILFHCFLLFVISSWSLPMINYQKVDILEYKKTKISIKTKDGERFRGFLVDANEQEIFLVKKLKEVPVALSNKCQDCKVYKYVNLKKVSLKNNFPLLIIAIIFLALAILLFAFFAAFAGESLGIGDYLKILLLIAVPFMFLSGSTSFYKSINKKLSKKKAVISLIKSKSAQRIALENIFNSPISEIDLLKVGYLNHRKSYLLIPAKGRSKKAFLISADDDTLFYVTKRRHVEGAISGEANNLKKFEIAKLVNIR